MNFEGIENVTLQKLVAAGPAMATRFIESLPPELAHFLRYDWEFWARPEQHEPPGEDWIYWLYMAGRGAGKTRSGSEWVNKMAREMPGSIGHLVAETAADARDVMVRGPSGILSCAPPAERPRYIASTRSLEWPNGSRALLFSAEDPEALRGPQCHWAWADELGKWARAQDVWDMLLFGLRLGFKPRCMITTTPRPIPVMKWLIANSQYGKDRDPSKPPLVYLTRGSTFDNRMFLAPSFFKSIITRYEGTRLGLQELYAEILDDNPDSLFPMEAINAARVTEVPDTFDRVVIAVDPPTTSGENADECGIIVAAMTGRDWRSRQAYVLADVSTQGMRPKQWAWHVIRTAWAYGANEIVVETNQGGELVEEVLLSCHKQIPPIVRVHAREGKARRAEAVASYYEQGRVHHFNTLARLEDQMNTMTIDFDEKNHGFSPDRVDALVYALKRLLEPPPMPKSYSGVTGRRI